MQSKFSISAVLLVRWTLCILCALVGVGVVSVFSQPQQRDSVLRLIETYRQRGLVRDSTYARMLMNAVTFYGVSGQQGESFLSEAKRLIDVLQDRHLYADYLCAQGVVYRWTNRREEARDKLLRSSELYVQLGLKGKAAFACSRLALLYHHQGYYKTALTYHLQALLLAEEGKSAEMVFRQTINTSDVYNIINQPREALAMLDKSASFLLAAPTPIRKAVWHNNRAAAYLKMNSLDSAWHHAHIALAEVRRVNDSVRVADYCLLLSQIAQERQQFRLAAEYLDSSMAAERVFTEQGLPRIQSTTQAAALYVQWAESESRPRSRTEYYKRALQFIESAARSRTDNRLFTLRFHKVRSEIYAGLGAYEKAFREQQQMLRLRDSLFNEDFASEIADVREHYESERRERQIAQLESESKSRKRVGFFFAALAGLLAVGAVIVYRNYREKRASEARLRAIELQLREQNTRLESLNQDKTEIMGIVSHDLKNPLTAIAGLADILATGSAPSQEIQEIAQHIKETTIRMFGMISSLLDAYRTESLPDAIELQPYNLSILLEQVYEGFQHRAAEKSITLELYNQPLLYASVDPQLFVQVMENLLSNALKFSPPHKTVIIRASVLVECLHIAVCDEGPGINAEDKPRLFTKFAKLSAQPTAGEHSTGLGLAIVKRLMESMRGTVWCEDNPDGGAVFVVEFPRAMVSSISEDTANDNTTNDNVVEAAQTKLQQTDS